MNKKYITKEYIYESLFLLMKDKKFSEISINEITKKAGVNRSTYYRHFNSKEEIIKFFLEEIMEKYLATYTKLKINSVKEYMYTIFKTFYKYKDKLMLIYNNNLTYLLLDVLQNSFDKIYKLKQTDLKIQYKLYFQIGGIYNTFILWFSHNMKETPKEITDIIFQVEPEYIKGYLLK